MCGIFGTWNYKGVKGSHLLGASALLRHRGPDDEGFLQVSDGAVAHLSGADSQSKTPRLEAEVDCENILLHRRLSILDLSSKGHQPMELAGRKIYITFNGEIYNFKALIAKYNLDVNTGTDTEVILLLYAKLGADIFDELRGMWAMAILDLERNELVLCRDRFGIKPLFMTGKSGEVAFSSEIKPLLELPRVSRDVSKETLLEFVVYGASSNPYETFFKDIESLKPGVHRSYNLDDMSFDDQKYYDLNTALAEGQNASGSFSERFEQSLDEHLIADVEVGSCLSGGLDSSLIVSTAADKTKELFKTFTCAFPGMDIDESAFAKQLNSERTQLDQHFVTPSAQDFLQTWDDLILLQERPFGSASIFAQYTVMKSAADGGVKVLLDGQGADEMLGGYYPFAGAYLLGLLRKGKMKTFNQAFKDLKENFSPNMATAMMRSGFYALPKGLQLAGRKKKRMGFSLLSEAAKNQAEKLNVPDRGSVDFKELSIKSVEFGLYELLQYEDRNAMRFSIESRVPFLDHRLVEWSIAQPVEQKISNGWTKFPIRMALENQGLASLAWRKDKLGFVAPQEKWREELGHELTKSVLEMELPGIFDPEAIRQLLSQKIGSNSGLSEFWRIFALLRWMELYKVNLV